MQVPVETPRRPRPPAKIRRSLAKCSTPPPAYASTFSFPDDGDELIDGVGDGLGNKWDAENVPMTGGDLDHLDDDLDWLNEKSREELTDLLVKADTLIKERESGMSFFSIQYRGRM
jgi:hypothetical protein